MAEGFEQRVRQLHDPGDGAEKAKAHDQREPDADAPCLLSLVHGQLVGEDGNEDQIVDAEHHFHDDQCHEGDPGCGVLSERQYVLHRGGSLPKGC